MKNPKIFHQKPEYWMKNISKLDFFKTIWVFFLKLDFIYNLLFKRLLGKSSCTKDVILTSFITGEVYWKTFSLWEKRFYKPPFDLETKIMTCEKNKIITP